MKRVFAMVLAAACVVGSTPSFARGGGHVGGFRGGIVRNPTTLLGAPAPSAPAVENRIPAPLAAPTQPPVINGPSLGAEEGLHTRATLPTDGCHLNDAAVGINRDHRDDAAFGEEDMIERTISVHENLIALAANVFKLRHESLEIAGGQGEQKPIAGPI
jgi:hypothetical protein